MQNTPTQLKEEGKRGQCKAGCCEGPTGSHGGAARRARARAPPLHRPGEGTAFGRLVRLLQTVLITAIASFASPEGLNNDELKPQGHSWRPAIMQVCAQSAGSLAVAVDDLGSGLWSGRVKQVGIGSPGKRLGLQLRLGGPPRRFGMPGSAAEQPAPPTADPPPPAAAGAGAGGARAPPQCAVQPQQGGGVRGGTADQVGQCASRLDWGTQ